MHTARPDRPARSKRGTSVIVGDFDALYLKWTDPAGRKISKDMVELNSTISQLGLFVMYGRTYPTTAEHTFFSS
jgi:hypothetical protein